jgi:nucleotide-binding universal stress UspA family protein
MKQPILVATDRTDWSLGAVRIGCALAERMDCPLHLLSVIKPPAAYLAASLDQVLGPLRADPKRAESLKAAVLEQVRATSPASAARAVVQIAVDSPALAIARYAHRRDAGMIVVGRSHGREAPWWGHDTPLNVSHLAHVPVLAVPVDATALPRRAVVAVDFSDFSLDAARRTAALLAVDAELHLAHVTWFATSPHGEVERVWEETYHAGAAARLKELAAKLSAEHRLRVETAVLTGGPAAEILRLVERVGADLIGAGSHGYGFVGRLVMGSVSTQLLRCAPCSVLVTPPPVVAVEVLGPSPGRARFGGDPFVTASGFDSAPAPSTAVRSGP